MPYNFTEISDADLKLFFAVINDLEHKARLMDSRGPLKFNNTPKGVSRDEQTAILYRLSVDHYLSFSMDGKSVWLNEDINTERSWGNVFQLVHTAYHHRFDKPTIEKKVRPQNKLRFDEHGSELIVNGEHIKISLQTKNVQTDPHNVLVYILVKHKDDIFRKFSYKEIANSPLFNQAKFPEQKISWRKYHDAFVEINKRIQAKTGFEKFFQIDSSNDGGVWIDQKYLQTLGLVKEKLE